MYWTAVAGQSTFIAQYWRQATWISLLLASKQTAVSVWQMPVAVCTVLNSWWWTERPSKTCRLSFQNKLIWYIGASCWFYYINNMYWTAVARQSTFIAQYWCQAMWISLLLASKRTAISVWQMPVAVCTVLNSWWWTERPPETCRVSFQNKINLIFWCILLVLLQK